MSASKEKIAMSPKSRNRANKTMVQFKDKGGSMSMSDSLEQIVNEQQNMAMKTQ